MRAKHRHRNMLRAVCAGLFAGAAALAWSPAAWGQGAVNIAPAPQVQQTQPARINPTLPGARTGLLTKAKGGAFVIDRTTYVLAAGALVEGNAGESLPGPDLKYEDVAFDVQYWLGTGAASRQIAQMIINFPK